MKQAGGRLKTIVQTDARGLDAAGTALAAIIVGGASGGVLLCLVLAAAHDMPRGSETPFATIALGAGAAGLGLSALVGFTLARRLGVWRSAVSAMVAVAGAALVGVLTTAADMAAGTIGLLVLAAICVAALVGAYRIFYVKDGA